MSNSITLAERLEQAGSSAAQSWIITELLLNAYPATMRQSIVAAAVPHWFTADMLAMLLNLPSDQAQERYAALQQLSIVQSFGDLGHTLHDLTRNGILKNLATDQRALFQQYSEKLLSYFVPGADLQHEVERIYHLLIANPDEGVAAVQQNARLWRRKGDFTAVENLLRNYRELIELGWLADEYVLELERQQYWTAEAMADRGKQGNDEQSEQYLRKALERFAPPDRLAQLLVDQPKQWREQIDTYQRNFVRNQLETARSAGDFARQPLWLTELGDLYRNQGDLEAALQQFDQALMLSPEDARTWAYRGETYRLMGRYAEALTDFDRAISLDDKVASASAGRGETYRLMGRYAEAVADFDRAISLDDKDAWAIASRGLTYRLMGRYAEAVADFDHAISLDDKVISVIAHRGVTYGLMGSYAEAVADFDRAISLDDKDAWAIASRGETYRLMGRYTEAVADFDRAISLDDKDTWTIAHRGETYRLMGRYTEAVADFDRAISLDDKDAWTIASRGETYRLMGRYTEAVADFDRAISLDDKDAWAIAHRGETYRLMGRYAEAVADFDRAITLDNKYASVIAHRGETYRLMGRYAEAVADFDRAISLDDKYAWAIASHGLTYRLMGRYTEAVADFDRAINLANKYAWAIAHRGYVYLLLNRFQEAQIDLTRSLSLEENDWYFYSRGLLYTAQNQRVLAHNDLLRAIELAKVGYDKDPRYWSNTLHLMLYHLAAGDDATAYRFLQEAFNGNVPVSQLHDVIQELDELLMVLPNHREARKFLERIKVHLEKTNHVEAHHLYSNQNENRRMTPP